MFRSAKEVTWSATTLKTTQAVHILTKHKKPFTDGSLVKGAVPVVTYTLFKDHKSKTEVMSAIVDVLLGTQTVAPCFHQRGAFDVASTKTTTRGVDIFKLVNKYFVENNVPIEKLVSITTYGAPAMTGRRSGFIALCKPDPDLPKIVSYHCIIHQQAICAKVMRFDNVMTPVIKIINSIRAKAKQHRSFKLLLQKLSAEDSDLFLHTVVRWLSRRKKILHRFCSLLNKIKAFMESREEDTTLLSDAKWLLDLAFPTDMTEKLNQLNT
ncbi:unnamed protein product [Lepeophtheirus salmonis]|uniref:(salmon louse) hypothetical protein n=1 Tax=Lepeophtheirus salmonis TaxID=72036 RepID=A0A7R8CVA0_LEPSM|nr:unnamed protein product [Lepeophtheirus salmonis]CAF2943265.1 unnamed protein product [Lepeophtheirus salmonis]